MPFEDLIKPRAIDKQTGLPVKEGGIESLKTPSTFRTPYVSQYAGTTKYDQGIGARENPAYARSEGQGFLPELGAGLLQSAGEIVGGTLEGIGYAGDIPQTINAIKGTETEWSNWLSDIGKSIKTWTGDVAPIYQDPEHEGTFRPWSFESWMANAPSISSTLSLMVPTMGAAKGISMLGNGMKLAGKMGKSAKFLTSAIGQAAGSRLMENGMEASQAFEQAYNTLIDMGISEQEAREVAGHKASDLWNTEWVMLAQDIPQYITMMKGIGSASKSLTPELAAKMGIGTGKVTGLKMKAGADFALDALGEAGEEGFQYVLGDRAKHLSIAAVDPDYHYRPSLRQYSGDKELWSSMAMGALGSGIFQTAGRAINKKLNNGVSEEEQRIADVTSWAPEIKYYRDQLIDAKDAGDAEASSFAASQLGIALASKASQVGNADALISTLNKINEDALTDKETKSLGLEVEDKAFITENFPAILSQARDVVKNYETYARNFDADLASRLAGNDVRRRTLEDKIKSYDEYNQELLNKIPNFSKLSSDSQQVRLNLTRIKAYNAVISNLKELNKDKELTKDEKDSMTEQVTDLEERIKIAQEDNRNIAKNVTPENIKKDAKINTDSAALIEYLNNEKDKTWLNAQMATLDALDKQLRAVQKERNKGEKKKPAKPNLTKQPKGAKTSETSDAESDATASTKGQELSAQDAVEGLDHEGRAMAQQQEPSTPSTPVEGEEMTPTLTPTPAPVPVSSILSPKERAAKAKKARARLKGKRVASPSDYRPSEQPSQGEVHKVEPKHKNAIPRNRHEVGSDEEIGGFDALVADIKGREQQSSLYEDIDGELAPTETPQEDALLDGTKRGEQADPVIISPKKDDSIIPESDTKEQPSLESDEFDPLSDDATFINLMGVRVKEKGDLVKPKGDARTDSQKLLDNLNTTSETHEFVYDVDLGEFFDGEFKKNADEVRRNLLVKDQRLLNIYSTSFTNVLDRLPIRVRLRNKKTGEIADGNFYVYKSATAPGRGSAEMRQSIKSQTQAFRKRILTGLLEGNEVTSGFFKSHGVPNTRDTKGGKLSANLNINTKTATVGFAMSTGNIIDANGTKQKGRSNSKSGGAYIYTDTTCVGNGIQQPIRLTPNKLSRQHAEMVFEAFEQAHNSRYKFAAMFQHDEVSPMSCTQLLSWLVVSGKEDTFQDKDKPEKYKPELVNKQLYLEGKKLHIGDTSIDLTNYSEEQKEKAIQYLMENKNYITRRTEYNKRVSEPFKIGEFEVTQADLDADPSYTKQQFFLNNGYLLTNSKLENGSSHENSQPFVSTADENSLRFTAPKTPQIEDPRTSLSNLSHRPFVNMNGDKFNNVEGAFQAEKLYYSDLYSNKNGESLNERGKEIKERLQKASGEEAVKIGNEITGVDKSSWTKNSPEVLYNLVRLSFIQNPKAAQTLLNTVNKQILETNIGSYNDEDILISVRDELRIERATNKLSRFTSGSAEDVSEDSTVESPTNFEDYANDIMGLGRVVTSTSFEPINVEEETAWIRESLGKDYDISVVDDFIRLTIDGKVQLAHGSYRNNLIRLYKYAEVGTGYHEAFHAIFDSYLTPKEREGILEEARKSDDFKGKNDQELEEELAEGLRNYMLTEGKAKPKPGRIRRFFARLKRFIDTLLGINTVTLQNIYKRINGGYFANNSVPTKQYDKTDSFEKLKRVEGFDTTQLRSITKLLLFKLTQLNNITDVSSIEEIDYSLLYNWTKEQADKLRAVRDVDPRFANMYNIFSRVSEEQETWLAFKELIEDMLGSMNIKMVEDLDEELHNDDFAQYTKASYEYSSRDNILANIKLFIATLPSNELDESTGMNTLVDFDAAWNAIKKEAYHASNIDEMISIFQDKANTNIFYDILLNGNRNKKTGTVLRTGLLNTSDNFKTQFFTAIKSHKHEFVKLIDKGEGVYVFQNAEMSSLSNNIINTWGILFSDNERFFDKLTKKSNYESFDEVVNKYRKIKRAISNRVSTSANLNNIDKFDTILEHISSILAEIDIKVSEKALENYFANSDDTQGVALDDFISSILDPIFTEESSFINYLSNQSLEKTVEKKFFSSREIHKLAEMEAAVVEDNFATTVVGPENNNYYVYSHNNFLTDFINNLNYDTDTLAAMYGTAGKQGSRFMKSILDGANIKITSFLGYKKNKETLDYFGIDPKQDYTMKVAAVMSNRLPIPTISDKKFYGFIEGMNRIDFNNSFINENGKFDFPAEAYNTFSAYYLDELKRVKRIKEQINKVEELAKGDEKNKTYYKHLIKNIHFKKYDSDGIPILRDKDGSYTGNGTKLIAFSSFEGKNFKFNANGSLTGEGRAELKKIFLDRTMAELDAMEANGMIKGSLTRPGRENNKLENVNLPNAVFKERFAKFNKNEDMAVLSIGADVAINSIMTTMEIEKMFYMDAAFYKYSNDAQDTFDDVTKRLAEMIAPGQNMRTNFTEDEFNAGVNAGDDYTTITLNSFEYNDTQIYNELEGKFKSQLSNIFGDSLSDAEINTITARRLQAFKKVDATDAQFYISPNMYRQTAIRLGEWDHKKNAAFERLMSETSKGEDYVKDLNLIMQPFKLVYYGVDVEGDLSVPTYDKMSLAVLLPQMVKGTKMEPLYDKMINPESPIDMIKFDSGVKAGARFSTDYLLEDGSVNPTFDSDIQVCTQNFKYLRKQTVTDPHHDERRMLGTQVKKIVLQNLRPNANYKVGKDTLTGAQVAEEISNIYSELSTRGREKFLKQIGFANGTIDKFKLNKMLRSAARSGGMPYSVIDAFEVDEYGNARVDIDALPDRGWTESKLISKAGKKTIDLNTAGNAFIQMSAYGLNNVKSEELNDLELMNKNGKTEVKLSVSLFATVIPNYDRLTFSEKRDWLKENFDGIGYRIPTQSQSSAIPFEVKDFLPEETGNVIALPLAFTALTGSDFDIDKLFLVTKSYYEDTTGGISAYEYRSGDEDGVLSTEDLKEIYREEHSTKFKLLEELELLYKDRYRDNVDKRTRLDRLTEATRFPTYPEYVKAKLTGGLYQELEHLTDIEELKPNTLPDVIVEIEESIDSMEDFIKKNADKSPLEVNHHKAIENRIVDLMTGVLTSEEHVLETKTPIDAHTDQVKEILNVIDKAKGVSQIRKPLEWYSLSSQSRTKQFYIGGQKGIGPYALNNVHHALTQVYDVGVKTFLNPFISMEDDIEQGKNNLARIYDMDGNIITDWFSALINAHVDIAKDPYIFRLNVNENTHSVISYLLRLGWGNNAFLFLNQPAIIGTNTFNTDEADYLGKAEEAFKRDSSLPDSIIKEYLDKAEAELAQNDEVMRREVLMQIYDKYSDPQWLLSNSSELLNMMSYKTEHDAVWYTKQAGFLAAYKGVEKESKLLSKLVNVSRIDGKPYGSSLFSVRDFKERYENVLEDKRIYNVNDILGNSFLGSLKNNSVDMMDQVYSGLTLSSTEAFDKIATKINSLTDNIFMNQAEREQFAAKISNDLFSAVVSDFFTSPLGRNLTEEDIKNLYQGENPVAKDLLKLSESDKFKNNYLISSLKPYKDEEHNMWFVETKADLGKDAWTRNSLSDAWRDLMEDEESRDFAMRLADYSFYSSGFNRQLFSFYHHLPLEYLEYKDPADDANLSYNEYVKRIKRDFIEQNLSAEQEYNYLKQVLISNPDYELYPGTTTKRLSPKDKSLITAGLVLTEDENPKIMNKPIIKAHGGYYEMVGMLNNDNGSSRKVLYRRINNKGFDSTNYKGHKMLEYTPFDKSIVDANNTSILSDEKINSEAGVKYIEAATKLNYEYIPVGQRLKDIPYSLGAMTAPAEQTTETSTTTEDAESTVKEETPTTIETPKTEEMTTQERLNANADFLNKVEAKFGTADRAQVIAALNQYDTNPEAKELIDKLKECL